MNHKFILLSILLPILLCGCSKDYFDELRHPLEIQGSFDPIYGFPLAKMSADMGTIVGMLDTNQDITVYIGDEDIISFRYEYTNHAVLSWTTEKGTPLHPKGAFDTLHTDTIIYGTQDFDIFEKLQYFDTNSFNVNELYITASADVQGFVNNSFQEVIATGANLAFDSLVIVINCLDGFRDTLPQLISNEPVSVTELLHSKNIPIFDKYNCRNVVEHKPNNVEYTIRLRITLPADQLIPGSTFQEKINYIGVDSIVADIKACLELPLNFYSKNISYVDTIPLDLSDLNERLSSIEDDTLRGENYTVHLNDSNCFLAFVVKNYLPVGLNFNVTFIDEYDKPILSTLFEGDHAVYSSPVKPLAGHNNTYVADGYKSSQFKIMLNLDNLKQLADTRRLIYDINLNTARPEHAGSKPYVAIRKDDRLDIRSYIIISPHADFTIPVDIDLPFLNR